MQEKLVSRAKELLSDGTVEKVTLISVQSLHFLKVPRVLTNLPMTDSVVPT